MRLSFTTILVLFSFFISTNTLVGQSEMPKFSNQGYSDMSFMFAPPYFRPKVRPMMTMLRWDLGFQRSNWLGFGVSLGMDNINFPESDIYAVGGGFHYCFWANGVMYKTGIGLAQLEAIRKGIHLGLVEWKYGRYFRQDIALQFNKRMTVGGSLVVFPRNYAILSYYPLERHPISLTYVMLHFGFTFHTPKK